MPRSLSAIKTRQLVVAVANAERRVKNATALTALNGERNPMWENTFEALDKDADRFDLIDMCNDRCYFCILNTTAGCIYLVSADGNVLSKILKNLYVDYPLRMAINAESKDLVAVTSPHGEVVTLYKLLYNQQ